MNNKKTGADIKMLFNFVLSSGNTYFVLSSGNTYYYAYRNEIYLYEFLCIALSQLIRIVLLVPVTQYYLPHGLLVVY